MTCIRRLVSLVALLSAVASPVYCVDPELQDLAPQAQVTASSEGAQRAGILTASEPHEPAAPWLAGRDWTPAPGTSPGAAWVDLSWSGMTELEEIVVEQGDQPRLTHLELDFQRSDGAWQPVARIGDSKAALPHYIQVKIARHSARALRICRFDGPVMIRKIAVYSHAHPPRIETGSDLLGRIIGIVTDAFGTQPVAGASVSVEGSVHGEPWHAVTKTDEHGMFQTELRVGAEGIINFRSELPDGSVATAQVEANDFTPGFTVPDVKSPTLDLDGTWKFASNPDPAFYREDFRDDSWKEIGVPAHVAMEGFPDVTAAGYRRHFTIPAVFRGRGLKLHFDAVYSSAEVWVNGQRVGGHDGGFMPFELDITAAAHIGRANLIAVLAREETPSSHLDKMSYYADFPLIGIFRKVYLFGVPEAHVQRMHIRTDLDASYANAELGVELAFENTSARPVEDARLEFTLSDPEGKRVPLENAALSLSLPAFSRVERRISFTVSSPALWEAEHPRLYALRALLTVPKASSEMVERRVGFRKVEASGTRLLINGVPVKLRGTGHLDFDPLRGRAETPQRAHRELELMKEANLDAFRDTISPALPEMIDYADEMGFYVEEEGPFNWVTDAYDLRFVPLVVQRTAEMLDRDRSHPSIIFWSLVNESGWGSMFDRANEFVRQTDPSRLTSAATSTTLSLATRHNPISVELIRQNEHQKVPVIWDEAFAPFQGIWGDAMELWRDPGQRDYWIVPHIAEWEEVMKSPTVQGTMIWAWSDEVFLVPGRGSEVGRGALTAPLHPLDSTLSMPGRGLVGDAPWGLVDVWQRKKPEFWNFKMLMAPLRIKAAFAGSGNPSKVATPETGPRIVENFQPGQPVTLTVENRYEFTNLSEITLEWSASAEHGVLHPEIAPRATNQIAIPLGPSVKPGDWLDLRFLDRHGVLILPWRLRLGFPPKIAAPLPPPPPLQHRIDVTLAGTFERFIGQGFEIAFDGASGAIRRALVGHHSVIYGTPKLHLLPKAAGWEDQPDGQSWRLTKPLEIEQIAGDFVVTATGTYGSTAGSLRYRITPAGEIDVSYQFLYPGQPVWMKEIGLQFGMPLQCDKLHWHRDGEWPVYPGDDIGRSEGAAYAHAAGRQIVPPQQSWAEDDTALGTNDFRSTKRNLTDATLFDASGYGVGILANGTQHLRVEVSPDEIRVNINDWYGGTSAEVPEWYTVYGRGRLLRGVDPNATWESKEVLNGTIRLFLLGPDRMPLWQSLLGHQ